MPPVPFPALHLRVPSSPEKLLWPMGVWAVCAGALVGVQDVAEGPGRN